MRAVRSTNMARNLDRRVEWLEHILLCALVYIRSL